MTFIQSGTKEYKQAALALFLGGFVTFSILYTTQPLMPAFSREFHVSASVASLTLSLLTGLLAISMLFAAIISDAIGKKQLMTFSMLFTSTLGLLTAFAPNFITGILTDLFSWRIALIVIGIIAMILSILFWYTIPAPRHSQKNAVDWKSAWEGYKAHLTNKRLMVLIILGFLFMGSFVILYNYIGFLLMAAPYYLSQTLIGFIFIVYVFGTFSSVYMGKKADEYGNAFVLKVSIAITIIGALITLVPSLIVKIVGISIFTFGFFACHSIASAWVGDRAGHYKAQASSLYLFFYYLGSSLIGSTGGFFWSQYHWQGVITLITLLLLMGYPLALYAQKEEQKLSQTKTM